MVQHGTQKRSWYIKRCISIVARPEGFVENYGIMFKSMSCPKAKSFELL